MADNQNPLGGLFQGTALAVPTNQYVSQSTEYPKWLQDAIYNQINTATAIANTPYQEYMMPTVAELTPDQQQARLRAGRPPHSDRCHAARA